MDNPNLNFTLVEDAGVLRMSGRLDIYATEEARAGLIEHLNVAKSMRLDLSGVAACDAAGVQLLWAARQSAVQAGQPFAAEGASAVRECCAQFGLSPDFLEPWTA